MNDLRNRFFRLLTLIYQMELQIIREFDITLLEYYTLQILSFSATVTPKEIATKLSLPKSNVTYILDSLENRELLERKLDENDRRSRLVSLTEAGREFLQKLFAQKAELLMPYLGNISKKESEYWMKLIDNLIRSFEGKERGDNRDVNATDD